MFFRDDFMNGRRKYLQYIKNCRDVPGGVLFKLHGSIEEDIKEKYETVRVSL